LTPAAAACAFVFLLRFLFALSQLGWTQKEIGELFGVARSVISESVENCHLAKIDTLLGWTQKEIGELFGVSQALMVKDINNCHLAKIDNLLGDDWNGRRGGRKSKASK